ncbi:hypothetical protein ACQKE8_18385 [Sphingobium limneticum]|jgi:hypothetical protein|uniref:hypothetical protein n=1 Tax=Sphingobium TaxID=165695 RepID=UPI0031379D8C
MALVMMSPDHAVDRHGSILEIDRLATWDRQAFAYKAVIPLFSAAAFNLDWVHTELADGIVDRLLTAYDNFPELNLVMDRRPLASAVEKASRTSSEQTVVGLAMAARLDPSPKRTYMFLASARGMIDASVYNAILRDWVRGNPSPIEVNRLIAQLSRLPRDEALMDDLGALSRVVRSGQSRSIHLFGEMASILTPLAGDSDAQTLFENNALWRGQVSARSKKLLEAHRLKWPQRRMAVYEDVAARYGALRQLIDVEEVNTGRDTKKAALAKSSISSWPEFTVIQDGRKLKAGYLKTQYGVLDPETGGIRAEKQEGGALCYGPYIPMPEGRYRIQFYGMVEKDIMMSFIVRGHRMHHETFAHVTQVVSASTDSACMMTFDIDLPTAGHDMEFVVIAESRPTAISIEALSIRKI